MQEFCSWLPSVQRCVSCVLGPRPLDLGVVVTWALPPPHLLAQACQHGPRDRESASASAGGGGVAGPSRSRARANLRAQQQARARESLVVASLQGCAASKSAAQASLAPGGSGPREAPPARGSTGAGRQARLGAAGAFHGQRAGRALTGRTGGNPKTLQRCRGQASMPGGWLRGQGVYAGSCLKQ